MAIILSSEVVCLCCVAKMMNETESFMQAQRQAEGFRV